MYTLVTVAVTKRGQLYVRNDGKEVVQGIVTVELIEFSTGDASNSFVGDVRLAAGGSIWWADVGNLTCPSRRSGSCCVRTSFLFASGSRRIQNVQLLALPKNLELRLARGFIKGLYRLGRLCPRHAGYFI